MSRCGDFYENRVTGEYAVVLRGSEDRGNGPGVAHLTARPGAAVVGEHRHPYIVERFLVMRGNLSARIAGKDMTLAAGESITVEAGIAHDWWNASTTQNAEVLVEVSPAPRAEHIDPTRFELLISTLFGLANDGKVDSKGRPYPLQGVVIAREFADVIVFTNPPLAIQKLAIALLAPVAALFGYQATYPRYSGPHGHVVPDPAALAAAGLPPA